MSKAVPPFSLISLIRAKLAGTWARIDSREFRAVSDQHERYGIPDSGYDSIPWDALNTRATSLTTASSNGGYLDQTDFQGYLAAMQPQTNLLPLGATMVPLDKNSTVTPYGLTALAPTWLHDELTAVAATVNTYGQKTFTRKTMLVAVPISLQLLKQSNAQEIVVGELVRAAGAELDKQGIMGTGLSGAPLGLLNIPQITSTSGATLAYSTLVTAMAAVATANAVVDASKLGFLTTPSVAGVLKQRYFSTANFPIWSGSIPAGTIDAMTAMSSTNVPTGSLLHGDFSRLLVAQWEDGLAIDMDPYTNFQQAYVTIRLCIAVDFVVASAASFQILTGVT